MRTLEDIKKDQDRAIFEYGAWLARAEQAKLRIFKFADEHDALQKQQPKEEKEEKND